VRPTWAVTKKRNEGGGEGEGADYRQYQLERRMGKSPRASKRNRDDLKYTASGKKGNRSDNPLIGVVAMRHPAKFGGAMFQENAMSDQLDRSS